MEGKCLGGGGYGIVIESKDHRGKHSLSMPSALNGSPSHRGEHLFALKLFRDTASCEKLSLEVKIQKLVYDIGIRTPKIIEHFNEKVTTDISGKQGEFLCGILMERIEPLMYGVQFHIILNPKDEEEIDTIVYTNDSPRGFYGSPQLLEAMWNDLSAGEQSDIVFFHNKYLEMGFKKYIQNIAYQMGEILQKMVTAKIRPIDIEFIIDKYGDLWVIDFGLCEFIENSENLTLNDILKDKSWRGLYHDMYLPEEKSELREWFNAGASSVRILLT